MTENNQHLVPEIRFKGFTNAWEQRELGDVVKIVGGATPSKANKAYWDGDIVWLSSQEIKDRYVSAGTYTITEKAVRESATKVVPAFTPLIVSRSGILARMFPISLPTVDVAINQDIKALFFDRDILDTEFFVSQLEMKENTILTSIVKTGTTVQSVNMPDFEKLIISIPSIHEQQKIGKTFKDLGNLITLHQRKLDGLVTLKDGFLQQMFPAANEVMPRVRFAGFTGNWEERRLEEMLTERNEQFEESEDYPLMSFVGNVGVVPKGKQYDRSFLVKGDGKKYKKTELNDFIYSSNNLETGSIGFNRTGKAVISPVYSIFYSSNDSESLFVGLLSKRKDFINKMIHFRQGVMYGQWRIHERDFLKIIVLTPTISEQNRIIDFFKNFDEQIAAQTAKLEQLRQLKAAYLQRMFI